MAPRAPRSYRRPLRLTAAASGLVLAAAAWGAFAFGAYYPWAYWPLAIAALAVGLIGLFARGPAPLPRLEQPSLAIALACLLIAVSIQLLPLPLTAIKAISPSTLEVIRQLEPAAAVGLIDVHPLSIAPRKTLVGLAVLGSFSLLVIGGARLFSLTGALGMAHGIVILGVLLALEGIIQRPLTTKVYGFWSPSMGGNPFGPFVNKNHFAGWMLMGLPIALGVAGAGVARAARVTFPDFRSRVLWLSSPEASRTLLWFAAAALLALSLVLTMSRSGMAVSALVALVMGTRAVGTQPTTARRVATVLVVCILILGVIVWIGVDVISERFAEANWGDLNDRQGAWLDAIRIGRQFPLVGTGFNTYGVATLFYQQHNLFWHYAQAHNDYLQLAAEGGLLLGIPAVACVALFCSAVRKRFREETSVSTSWIRAGATTGIVAIGVQEAVEFSLQMPGNAFLFAVLCAIALHRTPERHRGPQRADGNHAEQPIRSSVDMHGVSAT